MELQDLNQLFDEQSTPMSAPDGTEIRVMTKDTFLKVAEDLVNVAWCKGETEGIRNWQIEVGLAEY
jgi:hypothetical protein